MMKVEGLPPGVPEPYSENDNLTNFKPRLVLCSNCNYVVLTALAGPRCGQCHGNLITMLERDK